MAVVSVYCFYILQNSFLVLEFVSECWHPPIPSHPVGDNVKDSLRAQSGSPPALSNEENEQGAALKEKTATV